MARFRQKWKAELRIPRSSHSLNPKRFEISLHETELFPSNGYPHCTE